MSRIVADPCIALGPESCRHTDPAVGFAWRVSQVRRGERLGDFLDRMEREKQDLRVPR